MDSVLTQISSQVAATAQVLLPAFVSLFALSMALKVVGRILRAAQRELPPPTPASPPALPLTPAQLRAAREAAEAAALEDWQRALDERVTATQKGRRRGR